MKRLLVGTTLAAVAMFFWGFVYWGVLPFPWTIIAAAPDEVALTRALGELPESGAYVLPHPTASSEEEAMKRTEAGPLATVLITKQGRNPMDPMLPGFAHMWISALLMGMLLQRLGTRSYAGALGMMACVGSVAALWSNLGRPIWYAQPWDYHILLAVYDFSGWLVAGLVLAKFARE